jgi:hypothetical protein
MLSVCIDRSVAVWMRVRVLSHLRAGICPVRTRRHNISLIQPYPASGSFVRLQFITIDRAVALLIIASIRPDGRVLHASSCVPVGNKLHRRACEKHERERERWRTHTNSRPMHACVPKRDPSVATYTVRRRRGPDPITIEYVRVIM